MTTTAPVPPELKSERLAGGILPKVLTTFDMVAILVVIVISVSNDATFYGNGPVSIVYFVVGFVTFLIPGAIVTGQLGVMFPGEGSIYVWTHKAFGPFLSFFAGFAAWWPGILVILGSGSVVNSLLQYMLNTTFAPWVQGLVILAVIGVGTVGACLRFRLTQNMVNVIFVLYGLAILMIVLAGVLWLTGGHASYAGFGDFSTRAGGWFQGMNHNPLSLSSASTWSIYGFVVLALLGIEVPLNMGVEVAHPRSITRYLLWGSLAVVIFYLIADWGLLVAAPPKGGGQLSSLLVPIAATMGKGVEIFVGILFVAFFTFQSVVFMYSFARLIFVSGLDERLPRAFSKVNRYNVPHIAVIAQTIITGVLTLLTFMVLPYVVHGNAVNLSSEVYLVVQGAVTVIWCLSMVFLFVDVLWIIHKYQDAFAERRLASAPVFWACAIIGALASALAIYVTFTNPFSTQLFSRGTWFQAVLAISVVSLVLGALLYFVGRRSASAAVAADPASQPERTSEHRPVA